VVSGRTGIIASISNQKLSFWALGTLIASWTRYTGFARTMTLGAINSVDIKSSGASRIACGS